MLLLMTFEKRLAWLRAVAAKMLFIPFTNTETITDTIFSLQFFMLFILCLQTTKEFLHSASLLLEMDPTISGATITENV